MFLCKMSSRLALQNCLQIRPAGLQTYKEGLPTNIMRSREKGHPELEGVSRPCYLATMSKQLGLEEWLSLLRPRMI